MQTKAKNELLTSLKIALKTIEEQDFVIQKLSDEIAWFRRQVFGSKTERFITDNLQCDLDLGIESNEDATETQTEEVSYTRKKKPSDNDTKGHGRSSWPDSLHREKKIIPADFDTTGYM